MNLLGIKIANSTIQEGIVYILDPNNRIIVLGIGIILAVFIAKHIFKSIKRLIFIAIIIIGIAYFYLNFSGK